MLLSAAPAASACSWAHAPEPLGDTSALFIGGRMMDAAAYIDVATPEAMAPAQLPTGPHGFVKSVTFRVVERLKGTSPERFQLFALGLRDAGVPAQATPLLHWVDETSGVVYPFSTPWEPSPDPEMMSFTSCDPGFIEPVRGRRYLIFRGADGGLLGPLQFAPGQRPVRGYAFTEADAATDSPWVRTVRLLSAWRAEKAGAPVAGPSAAPTPPPAVEAAPSQGSVSFRRLLSDEEARTLLQSAGAKPYEVYLRTRGFSGVHRVPPDQASAEAISGARRHAIETIGSDAPAGGIVARARHALEGVTAEAFAADAQKQSYARMLIGAHETHLAAVRAVRSGAPMIYGAEFTGGPQAQAALARSPLVHAVRPGLAVRGRISAPDPENVASPEPPSTPPHVEALMPAELYAALRKLAAAPLAVRPDPRRPSQ